MASAGNGMKVADGEMDFTTELRVRTRVLHSASNAAVRLTAPLAFTSPKVYRNAVKAFYHIYLSFETEMERLRREYPKVGSVYFPELLRVKYFEKDLAYYYGPSWKASMGPPSPAAVAWISELQDSTATNPLLIVAYCQTMYAGLWFGGRVLRGWCTHAFGLKGKDGVHIFDFEDTISDHAAFRARFNEAFNSLSLSRAEKDLLIEQKKRIFEMNNAIFTELRASSAYRSRVLVLVLGIIAIVVLLWLIFMYIRS